MKNIKYVSTFFLLKKSISKEILANYLKSRKDLITKIVQENKCNLALILKDLPKEIKKGEFFKERENLAFYLSEFDLSTMLPEEYEFDTITLLDGRFLRHFTYYNKKAIKEHLRTFTNDETLINTLLRKVLFYQKMRDNLLQNLNDLPNEFQTYLEILMNSGVNVFENTFLKDMMDVAFFSENLKETYFKYRKNNLEQQKLEILCNLKKQSCESIATSITNPLNKTSVKLPYNLKGNQIILPTIVYDKNPYIFLIRRFDSGKHFYNDSYHEKVESYSTITEKNRSVFYGDSGIIGGYCKINSDDIMHISSYDSISKCSYENKYISAYLKYPEWLSMEELNRRAYENQSYNEIRMKGTYYPDFLVYYDEPNEITLEYSYEHNTPLVKILRKGYPNAVENFNDPYSHWK